jgi:MFS family permease
VQGLRGKAERRNFLCNLADGALAIFALNLVSNDFVVPAFLRKVGASDALIGVILSAPPLLTFMLPVLVAGYLSTLRLKKPFVLVGGIFQRMYHLAVALAAVLLLPEHATLFITVFVAALIVNSAAFSIVVPAWADLFAKVTPVGRRGTLIAWRWNLAILPIVLFAGAVDRVLDRLGFPGNYAILFAAAGVAMALSWVFVALIRERKGAATAVAGRRNSLREVPALLRRDRDFAWFLVSRFASQLAFGMVSAFFVLTAADRFGIAPESVLAHYLMVGYGSTFVGCVVLGRLGDRYGHRSNFLLEAPLVVGACVLALFAGDQVWFAAVFVLSGLARAVMAVSGISMVMEFGTEAERPGYIAVYSAVFMPLLLAGPVAGGLVRDYVGVTESFVAAMALALAGMAIMALRVSEPRRRARPSSVGADEGA